MWQGNVANNTQRKINNRSKPTDEPNIGVTRLGLNNYDQCVKQNHGKDGQMNKRMDNFKILEIDKK